MKDITIIPPPERLRPHVQCFWWAPPTATAQDYIILADGAPGLIFQHHNGHTGISHVQGGSLPVAFVYGQATAPGVNHIAAGTLTFGVHFRPHAWKDLLGIDASEVTNTLIGLDNLAVFPITQQLLEQPNPVQVVNLLADWLWKNLARNRKEDKLIEYSLQRLAREVATVRPEALPGLYHLSPRQYQRRFKQRMGVSPETYIRILKFQRSLQVLSRQSFNKLSDIGYELGYADQSHFIREFKQFSGYTPAAFLQHYMPGYIDTTGGQQQGHAALRLIACS